MKRIILVLLSALSLVSTMAQVSAGVRESRYVYGKYTFAGDFSVKLEHSLYSEKIGYQRVGIGVGYDRALPLGFSVSGELNGATTWNGNYQVVDLLVGLRYNYRRLGLNVTLDPRYDSGLDYETCWGAGASVDVTENISFLAGYTTIPLYRMSEKRVHGGVEFSVGKLSVKPELSFSVEKNTKFKNMRVLMSMNYEF